MKNHLIYFTVISVGLLYRCANPVTPTGGNKDIVPPTLLAIEPKNNSINQKPKQITFRFDENIQVNNAKEQIIVSPKPKGKYDVKTGKDFIIITFPNNALQENTTYSVHLNESVKDLNEGNPGLYKPIVFSTGNNIDTLKITGNCTFIEEPKSQKLKIHTLTKPNYRNIVSKSLGFTLSGLPTDSLYIIAFNDLNNNDSFELNEDVGLTKTKTGDSTNILIYPVQRKKINLFRYGREKYGLIGIPPQMPKKGLINYKDTFIGDSIAVYALLNNIDSIKYLIPKKSESKSYGIRYSWLKPSFLTDSFQQVIFVSNEKVKDLKTESNRYIDRKQNIDSCKLSVSLNTITCTFKNNQTGSIQIPFSFKTINGIELKDTFKTSLPVYTALNIENLESFEIYISIKNKNTGAIYQEYLKTNEIVKLWVLAGDHEINYYHDKNKNGHLDEPKIEEREVGEYYHKLPTLKIKEKMEIDLKLKGSEKP